MREHRLAAFSRHSALAVKDENARNSAEFDDEFNGSQQLAHRQSRDEDHGPAEAPRRDPVRIRAVSDLAARDKGNSIGGSLGSREGLADLARKMIAIHGTQAHFVAMHAATFARNGGHPLEAAEWNRLAEAIHEMTAGGSGVDSSSS